MIRVNLGCCDHRPAGDWVNVDIVAPADVLHDLRVTPWPFADSSVDEVLARDVFEHLPDKRQTMNELWRIMRPGGIVRIQVPHATDGDGGHCDPTHCSFWTTSDFEYYHPGMAERERFRSSTYYGVMADFKVVSMVKRMYQRHWDGYVVEIQAVLEAVK